jgi:hypothetical protein
MSHKNIGGWVGGVSFFIRGVVSIQKIRFSFSQSSFITALAIATVNELITYAAILSKSTVRLLTLPDSRLISNCHNLGGGSGDLVVSRRFLSLCSLRLWYSRKTGILFGSNIYYSIKRIFTKCQTCSRNRLHDKEQQQYCSEESLESIPMRRTDEH